MTEVAQRAAVLREAITWLGTPYHNHGRIKGSGVDCGTLLIECCSVAGVIDNFDPGHYQPDWHLHRSEERYLAEIMKYGREVKIPGPGDLALFRFGRCFSHGAIVVDWPQVIHSYVDIGCVLEDASTGALSDRPVKFFSLWGE